MAVFEVVVTPRARHSRVALVGGTVKVWVTAPPADGEANEAVVEVLAKALGVRRGAVSLVSGAGSRRKRVSVEGLAEDEVLGRLG